MFNTNPDSLSSMLMSAAELTIFQCTTIICCQIMRISFQELKFPGVEIGSHIGEWNLDAEELLPFWKVCHFSKVCTVLVAVRQNFVCDFLNRCKPGLFCDMMQSYVARKKDSFKWSRVGSN